MHLVVFEDAPVLDFSTADDSSKRSSIYWYKALVIFVKIVEN